MKKIIVLFACLLSIYSCTKVEPLDREPLIGRWEGYLTFDTYINDSLYSDISGDSDYYGLDITEGIEDNQFIIDEGEEGEVICSIDGTKFHSIDDQFVNLENKDGSPLKTSIVVDGSYKNDEITINYEYSYTTSGNLVKITSYGTMEKKETIQKTTKKLLLAPNKITKSID